MTIIGFVCADIAGKLMDAHRLAIQPIYDALQRQGLDCKWAQYSEPWGQIPGVDRGSVSCWVTCEPGMTSDDYIKRTFFHPHGLHPVEGAYVTARAPYGEYRPWMGYLSPGPYWVRGISPEKLDLASGAYPVTGWAKMDSAFVPGAREKAIQQHNLSGLPYAKTVLYAPSGNWHWATSFDKSIEHILTMFQGLAYNLIVKAGDYAMSFANYGLAQSRISGMNNVRMVHYDADVVPLYVLADAVITDGSSVAWEAIGLDKPTIQLNNMLDPATALVPAIFDCERCPRNAYDPNLRGHDETRAMFKQYSACRACGGVIKSGLPELRDTVINAVEHPEECAEDRRSWARLVNSPVDGHAAERCAEAIRRIAGI